MELTDNCKITELGKIISFIPLSPRLAKMLLLANKLNLGKYVLIIAVLLTVESIFGGNYLKEVEGNLRNYKAEFGEFLRKYSRFVGKDCGSDLFVCMNIAGEFL